MIEIRP